MKSQRLGLLMIVASLLVIVVIVALLFERQAGTRRELVRTQGVALARSLSGMAYEQLVPKGGQTSVLQALIGMQANPDLGYGVIIDNHGGKLAEFTAPGIIVPAVPLALEPSAWFGERSLTSPGDGRPIREFFGPILREGNLVGFVRLGYFDPRFFFGVEQISFFALLALPIFLLTPLFYLLVKREMKPLGELSQQIQSAIQNGGGGSAELKPSGELRDFIERFNRFIQMADTRIRDMEAEQLAVVTSNRMLSYKKDKVEAILQALPEAVLVLDESGVATYVSAKLERLLGVTPEAILGRAPQQWCANPDILSFLTRYQHRPLQAYRSESMEYTPDGATDKRIAVAAYPLFAPQDSSMILGALVVFRDATQEFLARRAGAEFVAHVSHELKTPLNTLAMYGEMLLTDRGESESLRVEAVNTIVDEVQRMAALINNLLNISRIETGSMSLDRRRTRLHDLLRDAFDNVTQSGRDKGVTFHLRLPLHLSSVALDKELFRIAVNNLLTNAIKYNRPGGVVTLAAEENDEEIVVHVQDTGIGIAAADRARIFGKFFRGAAAESDRRGGHGLGLYLAKEIVELHHGRLVVESEPGKGTQFSIYLKKTPTVAKEAIAA